MRVWSPHLTLSAFVGLASLVIGGGTWGSSSSENRMDRIRNTAWAIGITTAVSGIALALGRPLDENEKAAGLLTVIGVAFVFGVLTLGVLAYS